MAESGASGAAGAKAAAVSTPTRKRGNASPLASMQRDLRALSADLSRLAHGDAEGELPPSAAESEEGMTSASGASEGSGRRAGGTSGTDGGIPASSGDESYKQAGLKVRSRAAGRLWRTKCKRVHAHCPRSLSARAIGAQAIDELGASLSSGLSNLLGSRSWPVRALQLAPARRAPAASPLDAD